MIAPNEEIRMAVKHAGQLSIEKSGRWIERAAFLFVYYYSIIIEDLGYNILIPIQLPYLSIRWYDYIATDYAIMVHIYIYI